MLNGELIVETGDFAALRKKAGRTIDVKGRLIMPGFVNFHHHLYSSFAPGLSPRGDLGTFRHVLENLWWPLDAALDEESVYLSALTGLIESARCGVTTVFDHHASMSCVRGSLNAVHRAFEETGIRGSLCYEVSDRGSDLDEQIAENLQYFKSLGQTNRAWAPMFRSALGLHANFTLSESTMERIRNVKDSLPGIHIHVGESTDDLEFCREGGWAGPVDRLAAYGLVDENAFLVHCLHLSDRDFEILKEKKPVIVLNPESNANNQAGLPDFERLGGFVFGTDGMTGDVLASYRGAYLLGVSRGLSVDVLRRSVFDTAAGVMQRFFPGVGRLSAGSAADVCVLEYRPSSPLSQENLMEHLLYGAKSGRAYLTVCSGRILYHDGSFPDLDPDRIHARSTAAAQELFRRYYD